MLIGRPGMWCVALAGHGAEELFFDFRDCGEGVRNFRRSIILVQVQTERCITHRASVPRLEIVGQERLDPRPVLDEIIVVWVEPNALGAHCAGEPHFCVKRKVLRSNRVYEWRITWARRVWVTHCGRAQAGRNAADERTARADRHWQSAAGGKANPTPAPT